MKANDTALVTGASGFIGGRLVETLVENGAKVRVLTSNPDHCARIARLPIEIVTGDLRNAASLAAAVEGQTYVFHLAYQFGGDATDQMKANVEGTRALAEASMTSGAKRFIHFSSVAAYGSPIDGDLDENSPPASSTDVYARTKLATDEMLRAHHRARGLPVAILQPTIVYGPRGGTWTIRLIEEVKSRGVALPASGNGLCNAVYVDDVVDAALLAADKDEAIGESFLISGAAPVTWADFYRGYEAMTGRQSIVALDDAQFKAEEQRQYGGIPILGKVRRKLESLPGLKTVLAGSGPRLPDPGTRGLYAARTHVHIDKARATLGYRPAFDLARGMAATAVWAREAKLIS